MVNMIKVVTSRHIYAFCLAVSLLHFALGMRPLHELNVRVVTGDGHALTVWTHVPWAVAFGLVGLTVMAAGAYLTRRLQNYSQSLSRVFAPMALLPLAFSGIFLRPFLPWDLPGNVLFFVPVVVMASVAMRLADHMAHRPVRPQRDWPWVLAVFTLFSLFYTIIGTYFTLSIGEHSGDEGHYLVQARSLRFDGDLDLYRDLGRPPDSERGRYHISPASEGNAWYSLHPFGLSILLAPFMSFGVFAWHAVLGLISGAGLAAVLMLCRRVGAPMRTAVLVTALFGLSAYWGIYSSRALPEILGATLTAYMLLAALIQNRHRWLSVAVGALAVGALPWVHARFIPVSLLGFGSYGLIGLMGREERWPPKALRLSVFSILCLSAYGAFFAVMSDMFGQGSSYNISEHLLSCPPAMWDNLASNRGVIYSLPAFACMLSAAVMLLFKPGAPRPYAMYALVLLSAVLVTSCGTHLIVGGKCLPGRFLLVVTPLLVPAMALVLEEISGTARSWFLLLSVYSAWVFALELLYLDRLGKAFIFPVQMIPRTSMTFDYLWMPYNDPYSCDFHPYGILFFVMTALSFAPLAGNRRVATGALVLIVAAGIAAHTAQPERQQRYLGDRDVTVRRLMAMDFSRAHVQSTKMMPVQARLDVREVLDLFDGTGTRALAGVTTDDLGARQRNSLVSQPRLEENDWSGRGYAWTTVIAPFRSGKGERLLCIKGRLSGDAVPVLAIREGSANIAETSWGTMPEGDFEKCMTFRTTDRGDLYILLRLENGKGALQVNGLSFSPVAKKLMDALDLVVPPSEHLEPHPPQR